MHGSGDQHPPQGRRRTRRRRPRKGRYAAAAPSEKLTPPARHPATAPERPRSRWDEGCGRDRSLPRRISTRGRRSARLVLKEHRATENKKEPFVLLDDRADHLVRRAVRPPGELPNHRTQDTVQATRTALAAAPGLEVASGPAGEWCEGHEGLPLPPRTYVDRLRVRDREYTAPAPVPALRLLPFLRATNEPEGISAMLPTFNEWCLHRQEKFQKIALKTSRKEKSRTQNSDDAWVAIAAALLPECVSAQNGTPREFYTRKIDFAVRRWRYRARRRGAARGAGRIEVPLYAGPQEQDKLREAAPRLDLVRRLRFAHDHRGAALLVFSLVLYDWVGNWAWRSSCSPSSSSCSSIRSRRRAPVEWRGCGSWRPSSSASRSITVTIVSACAAMMELYKTEKINPLRRLFADRCPDPGFHRALLGAARERRAAAARSCCGSTTFPAFDPYFCCLSSWVATMIIQTRLNPEPPDPLAGEVMTIIRSPSRVLLLLSCGLVLYWLGRTTCCRSCSSGTSIRVLERANLAPPRKR